MERWGIECWRSIYLWWYSLDLMLDPTSWSHRIDDFSNEWRMCVVEFAPIDGRCSTFQCVQDWHLWIEVQIKVWILYECLREKKTFMFNDQFMFVHLFKHQSIEWTNVTIIIKIYPVLTSLLHGATNHTTIQMSYHITVKFCSERANIICFRNSSFSIVIQD